MRSRRAEFNIFDRVLGADAEVVPFLKSCKVPFFDSRRALVDSHEQPLAVLLRLSSPKGLDTVPVEDEHLVGHVGCFDDLNCVRLKVAELSVSMGESELLDGSLFVYDDGGECFFVSEGFE